MHDLINRQSVMNHIENEYREWGAEYDAMQILGDLEDFPSVQQEQRWIPVSERLPNTNGVYNVTRKISDGFECRNISDTCYYDGTNTWHDDTRVNHGRRYLTDVVAWMPLPAPYRPEGEEHERA